MFAKDSFVKFGINCGSRSEISSDEISCREICLLADELSELEFNRFLRFAFLPGTQIGESTVQGHASEGRLKIGTSCSLSVQLQEAFSSVCPQEWASSESLLGSSSQPGAFMGSDVRSLNSCNIWDPALGVPGDFRRFDLLRKLRLLFIFFI